MKYIKSKENDKRLHIFLVCAAVICFLLASSVLPFAAEGGRGEPCDIILCFVCTLPFFAGKRKAGIFALALGFAADLFINAPTAFSPVILLVCVFVVPAVARFFSGNGTLVMAICTLPCIIMKDVLGMAVSLFTAEGASISGVISHYRPFTVLADFACAICVAFIMRFFSKRLHIKAESL